MELSEELRELTTRHVDQLGAVPWASEADRWDELVFCLLHAFTGDPVRCRQAVESLRDLGVAEPEALAAAGDPADERQTVLRYVLVRHGFGPDDAQRAIAVLSRAAGEVNASHGGKIQRYLRARAEAMRDELVTTLGGATGPAPELRRGIAHWLQNAAGLPLSTEDSWTREFCRDRGISPVELQNAADAIDFNLALVDDVIRIEKSTS